MGTSTDGIDVRTFEDMTDLERLHALVRLETPSLDAAAASQIIEMLAGWWRAVGADVRIVAGGSGPHLVAELPGIGDPVLLVGHCDTVWPHGTLTGDVPWSVDGDIVRGPGVYDMKSGLVVMLSAAQRLRGRVHRAVRVVVVCDEEVGSPDSRPLIGECVQGVSAVIGFESPHPDGALKVGRRGSTRVRLAVTGKASHAALDPAGGISAVDELVDQLMAVRDLVTDPTLPTEVLCNIGTVNGGGAANVVPAHAEAEIGLRFIDRESETRVLDGFAALRPIRTGAGLDVEVLSQRPSWPASTADTGWLGTIADVARGIGQSVTGRPAAGAGDTNLTGGLGIPTVDGFGPSGGGAHAVTEHASLASLGSRVDLLEAVLTRV